MKELGKRLAEVEYVLKQMDINYIEKIPEDVLYYISENKDYEYSTRICNNRFMDTKQLHIDTIAILTYINTNFFMNSEEKESFNLLMKKAQLDIEKRKSEQYKYDDLFSENNKNENKSLEKNKSNQLIEYKKKSWIKRLFSKIFS